MKGHSIARKELRKTFTEKIEILESKEYPKIRKDTKDKETFANSIFLKIVHRSTTAIVD